VPTRLQIRNKDGNRMIQVQNGRLHFNWLGEGGDKYARYANVREEFAKTLELFVAFVASERLGELRPNQWEVTYLNHIHKATVWTTPGDWGFFKPLGPVPTINDLVEGESFAGEWHFVIPGQRGRLHVQWQHGKTARAIPKETIVLTLTARGPVPEGGNGTEAVLKGVDLGHDTIVRAFRSLMTDDANRYWELNNAD